jgi:hypothetical protein
MDHRLTREWIEEQLTESYELGNTPQNSRDFALLSIALDYMGRDGGHAQKAEKWQEKPHHGVLTMEQAREWVASMVGSDPAKPKGGKWSPEEVKPFAQRLGFATDGDMFPAFYAIMNAMYSDYYDVARKYNMQNNPTFFAVMAASWLHDDDAVEDKAEAYWEYIVKH